MIYRISTGVAIVGGWVSDLEHDEVIKQKGSDLTLDEKIVIIPEAQFMNALRAFVAESKTTKQPKPGS